MAERDSGWVGGGVVDAQDARLATGTLVQAGAGPLQVRQGIKPATGTPGLVKQTGTASKNVTIEPFQAMIQATRATAGGPYLATLDAQKTIDLLTANPADATNARRDLIIARQSDTQWSDGSTAMAVQQVVGTPSGSPVDPTPAAGDYITLARVTVPANATTVVSGNITDLRPFAVATGAILPVASQTERDALAKYTGMCVWRTDTNQMEAWNGTIWDIVGPRNDLLAAWTSYTPSWTATTTNPTLGNGTLTGRYMLIGKTCFVSITLTIGSTTSVGSGTYLFGLPFTSAAGGPNYLGVARFTAGSVWIGQVSFGANSAVMNATFPSNSTTTTGANMSATTPAAPASGNALTMSVTFQTA